MTDSPRRFKKLERAYLGTEERTVNEVTVEYAYVEPRGVRLKFREVSDRTVAQSLAGALILVDEEQRIKPKRGAYFVHDMIGLRVLNGDGMTLGTVKDVLRMPAQDVYVVENGGREWMLPAVKEFVSSIDLKSRTMRVQLIEGLMD